MVPTCLVWALLILIPPLLVKQFGDLAPFSLKFSGVS